MAFVRLDFFMVQNAFFYRSELRSYTWFEKWSMISLEEFITYNLLAIPWIYYAPKIESKHTEILARIAFTHRYTPYIVCILTKVAPASLLGKRHGRFAISLTVFRVAAFYSAVGDVPEKILSHFRRRIAYLCASVYDKFWGQCIRASYHYQKSKQRF